LANEPSGRETTTLFSSDLTTSRFSTVETVLVASEARIPKDPFRLFTGADVSVLGVTFVLSTSESITYLDWLVDGNERFAPLTRVAAGGGE